MLSLLVASLLCAPATPARPQTAFATAKLPLRSEPKSSALVVATLPPFARVEVLTRRSKAVDEQVGEFGHRAWLKVKADGRTGWTPVQSVAVAIARPTSLALPDEVGGGRVSFAEACEAEDDWSNCLWLVRTDATGAVRGAMVLARRPLALRLRDVTGDGSPEILAVSSDDPMRGPTFVLLTVASLTDGGLTPLLTREASVVQFTAVKGNSDDLGQIFVRADRIDVEAFHEDTEWADDPDEEDEPHSGGADGGVDAGSDGGARVAKAAPECWGEAAAATRGSFMPCLSENRSSARWDPAKKTFVESKQPAAPPRAVLLQDAMVAGRGLAKGTEVEVLGLEGLWDSHPARARVRAPGGAPGWLKRGALRMRSKALEDPQPEAAERVARAVVW